MSFAELIDFDVINNIFALLAYFGLLAYLATREKPKK